MRRLLTTTGIAAAAVGLLVAPASASTPLPKGNYYGQLSGAFQTLAPSKCPVAPPSGSTMPGCGQLKGSFTVAQTGGKKITGTYVGTFAGGPSDPDGTGQCVFTNEVFTFTAGKGNTFKAVMPNNSSVNRVCSILLASSNSSFNPGLLTTEFSLQISGGTGRFKGLVGPIEEDGVIVPNVSPSGSNGTSGRSLGMTVMAFGAIP